MFYTNVILNHEKRNLTSTQKSTTTESMKVDDDDDTTTITQWWRKKKLHCDGNIYGMHKKDGRESF